MASPAPECLKEDGLHLNEAGYEIWTKILTPILMDTKSERP